jgi:hypothetical protein
MTWRKRKPRRASSSVLYYRHRLPVRIMHWINVVCLTILFMSGLNIFNANPALNWASRRTDGTAPLLEIGAKMSGQRIIGVTRIAGHEFDTTDKLGVFYDAAGEANPRAFPSWITVPSTQWLAMARQWHFFFAWLFVVNASATSPGRCSAATWRATWRRRSRTGAASAARSSTTSSSSIRRATRRSATTCCRSSRTWS